VYLRDLIGTLWHRVILHNASFAIIPWFYLIKLKLLIIENLSRQDQAETPNWYFSLTEFWDGYQEQSRLERCRVMHDLIDSNLLKQLAKVASSRLGVAPWAGPLHRCLLMGPWRLLPSILLARKIAYVQEKKKREALKPLPTSIKEKETHWPKEPWVSTRKGEDLVRIWRVTSRPLPQTKILRATGFFKGASSCFQFVCMKHRVSIELKSSLMGFLCIKAEPFQMI